MRRTSQSLSAAAAAQHRIHGAPHLPPSTSAAFTIVPLTDALLPLLEPVEAASYPPTYCEGIAGYAKRLHARPACPSFVCLQRTSAQAANADVAALVAAGAVDCLRAIGYAITCRLPRRTASVLLRDAPQDDTKTYRSGDGDGDGDNGDDREPAVADNHTRTTPPIKADDDRLPFPLPAHRADTFYVHDVAVHPEFRGLGVAGALWAQIEETRVTLQLKRMSLVAVFGASSYWARHGFREVARKALPDDTVRVLEDYGDHAVFMERED
ncbi:N-acetyltransferase GCN5 [Leptomonas pyrrhocoris]|uniref:N-acetyltransferase GCN5 n=1 Tax=Leptomonas pyrrhocoris TaxID=157538 RepID=A0A0M9FWJ0_LEPPY|nr:N-acetyltransferase GCN5 [Leptomonas pyrrhocoris]XP_015655965.1 N-acetyltransferase GCN5 [Leptomonas pyrrhocoris]KPA77525.1 N-acetyltransferase GCN5 [Leptomonas pyrrhocoris]KPA77526.1 N-acetyltransferase GCN5 [Leptomonas pyrrhocoris]|eukprot:XP_015655964.1 N-acetyltransferase GCN5 [Leptomonas pyrrhocoris]